MLPSITPSSALPLSRYSGWLQDYLGIDHQQEQELLRQTAVETLEQWSAFDQVTGATWHACMCPYLVFKLMYPLSEPVFADHVRH